SGTIYIKFNNAVAAKNAIQCFDLGLITLDTELFSGSCTLIISKELFEDKISKKISERLNNFKLEENSCRIVLTPQGVSLIFKLASDAEKLYAAQQEKYKDMKVNDQEITISEKDYKDLRSRNTLLPKFMDLKNGLPEEIKH